MGWLESRPTTGWKAASMTFRKLLHRMGACGPMLVLSGLLAVQPHRTNSDVAVEPGKRGWQNEDFFADRSVRLFRIELTDAGMNSLRRGARVYVSGTVLEGGRVYTNVGIHLKGMGSFQSLDQKPSFVIKFNKYLPEESYCGLTKLMLNNSIQDQSFLSELLATQLFRDAGVPAARVTHSRVMLNGRDLGLYVAI